MEEQESTTQEPTTQEPTTQEPKKPIFEIPSEFKKVIIDMTKDILVSFPEQEANLHQELKNLVFETDPDRLEHSLKYVFVYCKTFYPVKFFDILYQNQTIFEDNNENNVYFLPGVNFKTLWNENISDKTRETIWKYLQLVLFTVVSGVTDERSFGDTAKLFEAVNEEEFKSKLEETISQMHTLFDNKANEGDNVNEDTGNDTTTCNDDKEKEGINLDDLPDPNNIHEHVTNMMNGKLGKLAREIAEETAADLNINMENASSVSDVFKNLIKNTTKLLGLVKSVGSKLDDKLKSGDMKESELLEEASELMKKMKNMPGMGDLQSMFSKMGMNPGGGKGGGKVNMNAMQANLSQKLKAAKNKERLFKTMEERQKARAAAEKQGQQATRGGVPPTTENIVYTTGESAERSTPGDNKQGDNKQGDNKQGNNKKKKKKNKK